MHEQESKGVMDGLTYTDSSISGFFKAAIATKNHKSMPVQLYLCIILYMEQHPWALDCSLPGAPE